MPRLLLLAVLSFFTQTTAAQETSSDYRGPGTIEAHRRTAAIAIDGRLDDADWLVAPAAGGFVQQKPVEGARAEHDTRVQVAYDDHSIWVAARMFDAEPQSIARQLVRRDDLGTADWIGVGFDPDLDRRTGYAFILQASGVQADQYLFNDGDDDGAWDAVWESAVRIDSLGWVAEMRIPLSQIRYEASSDPRDWGITFVRSRVASNEESHFALISRTQEGVVSQFGRLTGVRIASAPRRIEVRPYTLAGLSRLPGDEGNPFHDATEPTARAGFDVKVGLGSQFTVDATINPDFGQVEADPAVINLTAYETFFQERRPFFVEGSELFDYGLSGGGRLFYSRRIGREPHRGDPGGADFTEVPEAATILAAAKVTGRTSNGFSLGALATVTARETGRAFFGDDGRTERFTAEPRTEYGVLRARRDFRDGESTFGAILTGLRRELPADGSFAALPTEAFAGGIDWEHSWGDRTWAIFGYAAGTHVRGDSLAMIRIQRSSNHWFQRPDSRRTSVDSSRTSLTGLDWRATFEKRRGQHWTGAVWLAQVTPGFEVNDLGFSSRQEVLDGGARIEYQEIEPGELFREYALELSTFHNFSYDLLDDVGSADAWKRSHVRGSIGAEGEFQFLNYWGLGLDLSYRPEMMDRTATRGGPLMRSPASWSFEMGGSTDFRRKLVVEAGFEVNRGAEDSGSQAEVGLEIRYRPSDRVELSLEPAFGKGRTGMQYVGSTGALPYAPTYGRRYVFGDLERREFSLETRVEVSFTPRLSLQIYAQPLLSSGDYTAYKQLTAAERYAFDVFEEGTPFTGGRIGCVGGRTCVDDGTRWVDFDGDGTADWSFRDRPFNVRSLIGNAVLRWEFRPGSTIYLVWQRFQEDEQQIGDFDFRRDADALLRSPSSNVFMVKMSWWIGM